MKLVFVASPLSTQHLGERAKTGWLGIRRMCPNGATCLPQRLKCISNTDIRSLHYIFFFIYRFHAYSVIMEMDSYEPSPIEPRNNRANIVLKKRTFGGVPPGAGMREDVALLFEEIEETRNTIAQVQAIMEEVPEPKVQVGKYNNNENQGPSWS